MAESPRGGGLLRRLDALAERGEELIRQERGRMAEQEASRLLWPAFLAAPVIVLFVQAVLWIHGETPFQVAWWVLAILSAAPVLLGVGLFVLLAHRRPVDRVAALGRFDLAGDFHERIVTADALLRSGGEGPFELAAIEDGESALSRAENLRVEARAVDGERVRQPWRMPLIAALMIALIVLIGRASEHAAATGADELPSVLDGTEVATRTPQPELDVPVLPDTEPRTRGPETRLPPGESQAARDSSVDVELEAKKNQGQMGSGESGDAQASSGQSDSQGAPSGQGQPMKQDKPKKPKENKKKKDATQTPEPRTPDKKDTGDESGSTAGRGSSKGSNKNPVTSDWKSKDLVTTEDDEEIDDDEEVEDEESDSEARGGMQPRLRDRKPPVSRDLTIGFGNQADDDANGRGGPSQQKKSRGTASLVLGVPIPDRIKGQPNPGKTKVTQERVEAKPEDSEAIDADDRGARAAAIGPLAPREMTAWMRDVVRSYFLRIRAKKEGSR